MIPEKIIDAIKKSGVVGAGGAGFPAHAKLSARVDTVIVNGAECEPLLHKDKELMRSSAQWLIEGLAIAMEAVHAERGIIALKRKAVEAVQALKQALKKEKNIEIIELEDFYPAGDELVLARETTGRQVPFGALPFTQGLVISNVETMIWISRALEGLPVTHKTLTINGAVSQPVTMTVPVGVSFAECITAAGGPVCDDPVVIAGGAMMGTVASDLEQVVTKTTAGLIVLPPEHPLAWKKTASWRQVRKSGHSACDGCSYCTEYCPRYLLGHPVQPHRVMRTLGMGSRQAGNLDSGWAAGCVECGLCGLFSCPEDLRPDVVCGRTKREQAHDKSRDAREVRTVHPAREGRRVPIKKLIRRLGLQQYDVPAPLSPFSFTPVRIQLPLKQHIGAAAIPLVKAGDAVKAGQLVGEVPEGSLGARIHTGVGGRVSAVDEEAIFIEVM